MIAFNTWCNSTWGTGTDYTTTDTWTTGDVVYISTGPYGVHTEIIEEKPKKKCKKPIIAEDAITPEYKRSIQPIKYKLPFLSYRMMFDKSGKLPKRIRRIRK